MAGGGKAVKMVWNLVYNDPLTLFLAGGFTLGLLKMAATSRAYHKDFGIFDVQRREELAKLYGIEKWLNILQ